MQSPEPWFAPEYALLFVFVALAPLLVLLETYARRGRYAVRVLGAYAAVLAAGVAVLVAARIGYVSGQPAYVVWPLALSGALVTLGTASGLAKSIRLYFFAPRASA